MAAVAVGSTASAAPLYWDTSTSAGYQPGSGTWNTGVYWTTDGTTLLTWTQQGGGSTTDAVFAAGNTTAYTINVSGAVSVNSLTVDKAGYTFDGVGSINLGSGGLTATHNTTFAGSSAGGILIGTGGVTINGSGRTLTMNAAQSFTGQVSILNGYIKTAYLADFGANSGLGAAASGDVILGTAGSGTSKEGILNYNGTDVATNRTFSVAAGGSGGIEITSAATLTLNGAVGGGDSASVTEFVPYANGGVILLNAVNTYAGATWIYGTANGVVKLGNDNVLPTGTTVQLGYSTLAALLDLNGHNQQLAGLTIPSTTSNSVYNSSSTASTLTLNIASGSNTYAGLIGRSGGDNLGLTKTGAGTLVLTGANTYVGNTTVSDGTLQVGAAATIPYGVGKGNLVLNGGASAGIFDLNGIDTSINGLAGVAGDVLGQVVNNMAGTAKTLTVGNNNATSAFAGVLKDNTGSGGTLGLNKVGTGTLTLSGVSTYSGPTTVNAGVLNVTAAQGYTGQVSILNGSLRTTHLADFGVNSGLGAATSGDVILGTVDSGTSKEGILNYVGASVGTDRTFSLASGGFGGIMVSAPATLTLNGAVGGGSSSAIMEFVAANTGNILLNATNTYSGATWIYGTYSGIVQLGADNALPTATAVQLGYGSTMQGLFDLNGHDQLLTGLTEHAGSTGSSYVFNSSSTASLLTLDIDSGTNAYAGAIGRTAGNNLGLTKTGDGTLILSGANTYAGDTTIDAGVLTVAGSSVLDVNDGGLSSRFLGTGTLNLDGDLLLDVADVTGASGIWSLIDVANLTESYGVDFAVAMAGGPSFVNSGDGVWNYVDGMKTWSFAQSTGTLSLSTIPEPGTMALLGMALSSLTIYVWRKRRK